MNDLVSKMNPGQTVPNPKQRVTVEVEGVGSMPFDFPEESIASLASQVIAMEKFAVVMANPSEFTVTGWDPESRRVIVKWKGK